MVDPDYPALQPNGASTREGGYLSVDQPSPARDNPAPTSPTAPAGGTEVWTGLAQDAIDTRFLFKVGPPPQGGVPPRPLWVRPEAGKYFFGIFFWVKKIVTLLFLGPP